MAHAHDGTLPRSPYLLDLDAPCGFAARPGYRYADANQLAGSHRRRHSGADHSACRLVPATRTAARFSPAWRCVASVIFAACMVWMNVVAENLCSTIRLTSAVPNAVRVEVTGVQFQTILDLTQGEAGTRGSASERAAEAEEAARILGVGWRQALDLPDGRIENTWENRLKIAGVLRELQPRVVILPYWQARHPDHATAATLGYEACFVAGLSKVDTGTAPHRPFKIIYASLYADVRPSFVVDITEHVERRFASLMVYRSQYENQSSGGGIFVPQEEIRERTFALARFYGLLGGVWYAEPFVQKRGRSGRRCDSHPGPIHLRSFTALRCLYSFRQAT